MLYNDPMVKKPLSLLICLAAVAALAAEPFETGVASWYGGEFHGQLTANGEIFDTFRISAAHQTLPFGTVVRVVNTENGLSVDVRINDRGPFAKDRIIDLSFAAAQKIEMIGPGTAEVELHLLHAPDEPEDRYRRIPDDAQLLRIQIGAFSSQQGAQQTASVLEQEGLSTEIIEGSDGLIRVFASEVPPEALEHTVSLLEELGYSSVLIRVQKRGSQ